MRLKKLDFNLRQNMNSDTIAISNKIENWQSKTNQNILMLNSITLTKQRSVLVKRRCSADCSSAERSWSASSGRAIALPRNLIVVPRAGFTTARVRRYRSPFSSVHAKKRASEIQKLDRMAGNWERFSWIFSVHLYRRDCPQGAIFSLMTPIKDIKAYSEWSWQFAGYYGINRPLISA